VDSASQLPTSCTLIGSPSLLVPNRIDRPGKPVTLSGTVAAAVLEKLLDKSSNPIDALRQYPATFRKALENHNRICLCSFMAAEYDDLPEAVKKEVQTFADVNVAWLSKVLSASNVVSSEESESRARAIFSAVAGAQLMARSRSDLSL
jgi:TetR/AcrR family transcriptional regulator, transcriptional repressor for nem operon